ncbi:neutral/alkaline non-lysosomal ceramidase N-terminal domain-containing protein [Ruania halotolerans]|uniref:neutral/alkaline non-lysosomal ceramidase N-terminal domain-containing protein n=1 Tax=Ruania halotolerans TaxID=2897773 RepID=UPI001E29D928|nr:neutral/alkaline non-lysosomal ceramidase N-terminal domain-containing protein [Ruania halotolerans]UFU05075.1 neutral/alkaline non-lysosomal ceramidase N-terminal domain-containing protein [Ruania halotolerans]
MSGYAGRAGPSLGVHQPTSVRALVIDDVAIVALDVCAVHARTSEQITAAVRSWVRTCVVTATHTHAGPCVAFGRVGGHDARVHEALVVAAIRAVEEAASSRRPCEGRLARGYGAEVARNRRHPDRAIDPPVWRLTLRAGDLVIADLVSYPCHPVVLDASNRLIAADYPGALRAAMEQAHPGSVCVFLTGAAGDVNTGDPAEASYAESGPGDRTPSAADRIGRHLAAVALAAEEEPVRADGVRCVRRQVLLPFARPDAAERAAQVRSWRAQQRTAEAGLARVLQAWIDWAIAGVPDDPAPWTGHITALDLGVPIVFLPGEPFLETAAQIEASVGERVLIAGYADDVPGYLPPSGEYAHGGYEVLDAHRYYAMPAPFAPGCAERVAGAAVETVTAARH